MNYLNYCVSGFLINPKLLCEFGTRRKMEFSIAYCSLFIYLITFEFHRVLCFSKLVQRV